MLDPKRESMNPVERIRDLEARVFELEEFRRKRLQEARLKVAAQLSQYASSDLMSESNPAPSSVPKELSWFQRFRRYRP